MLEQRSLLSCPENASSFLLGIHSPGAAQLTSQTPAGHQGFATWALSQGAAERALQAP